MPSHNTPSGFTTREELFVMYYVAGDPRALGNGTKAAIAAGYSKTSAAKIASDLLAKPKIRAAIDAELKRISQKLRITTEKVLQDIERIANKAEKAGEFGAALKGKELLGRNLKMFTDRLEVRDTTPRADRLAAARARRNGEPA